MAVDEAPVAVARTPEPRRLRRPGWRDGYLSLVSITVLLVAWYLATTGLHLIKPLILPSPDEVWNALVSSIVEGTGFQDVKFQTHVWGSLSRLLAGWALAVVTAIPLGLLMGTSRRLSALLDPIIEFIRPLPPTGYFILLLLWFGTGDISKITLLFLAVFPYVLINTMSGVRGVRQILVRMAMSMGSSRLQTFRYVVLPSAMPSIFAGLRLGLGNAFATLVAAEIVAADSGLGKLILDGSRYLATDLVFVGIITVGVLAICGDYILRWIERRMVPWRGLD